MLPFLNQNAQSFRHGIHPDDYKAMTRDMPLDFFVLFSSISAVFGAGGQANL